MRPCSYMRSGLCPAGLSAPATTVHVSYTLITLMAKHTSARTLSTTVSVHSTTPNSLPRYLNVPQKPQSGRSLTLSLLEPFARGRCWDGRTVPRLDKVFLSQSLIHSLTLSLATLSSPSFLPSEGSVTRDIQCRNIMVAPRWDREGASVSQRVDFEFLIPSASSKNSTMM